MKRIALSLCIGLVLGLALWPVALYAADQPAADKFYDAPVMPGAKVVKSEGGRVTLLYDLPYEKVLAWYEEAMKKYPDEKFREWKEQMYIEDQGGAQWHSIGIYKGGGNQTSVVFVKDNWTWIFSTLFIRFVGVFVVLMVLWLTLSLATKVMAMVIKEEPAKR